jgi:hypothetical protein
MYRSFVVLFAAATLVLMPAAGAKSNKHKPGLHAHAHHARTAHRVVPAAPKDPYADYWNDPSRQGFPSWGMTDFH